MMLTTPIRDAGRVFKMYASRLEKLEIYTLQDLLYYIPMRYDNYAHISKIAAVQPGEIVTVQGQVLSITSTYTRSHKTLQKALITDETGPIEVIWFNQPFLTKSITTGDTLSLSGKVEMQQHKRIMQSPDFEILTAGSPTLHTGRLVPVYHETRGVTSKWLRRQIFKLLAEHKNELVDYLPEPTRHHKNFLSLSEAIEKIHFPGTLEEAVSARNRLAFDELFLLQLRSLERKKAWEEETHGQAFVITPHQKNINALLHSLPFQLTTAQSIAVHEIFCDLQSEKPMNRLLQGDVGSGKTVVGTIAMFAAYLNGYQSVLMAPTEILAEQHFKTVERLLTPFGVKVELVTGSKKLQRDSMNEGKKNENHSSFAIRNSQFDILVGTHAVLSSKIAFDKLGLVIIDEQQRFGVEQRGIIRSKGDNPHLLTMTATPIPRTVALTMYGDLDLSYLSELPGGRKKIKTWLVPPEKRSGAYNWIRQEIRTHNSQAFIICPLIEESENMVTIRAASKEYERLQNAIFPDLSIGLLHGKLKAKEKEAVLTEFRERKYDILVATPVVEVGIDIPNATIIMIEAAERFGLAQLHQLRGRVGRGEKQSYCLLFTDSKSPTAIDRLKAMETRHIGADLAELDLRLRGPGDMFGTAQHGLPMLKVASFSDFALIEQAKEEAIGLFPQLGLYPKLEEKLQEITLERVSPD